MENLRLAEGRRKDGKERVFAGVLRSTWSECCQQCVEGRRSSCQIEFTHLHIGAFSAI